MRALSSRVAAVSRNSKTGRSAGSVLQIMTQSSSCSFRHIGGLCIVGVGLLLTSHAEVAFAQSTTQELAQELAAMHISAGYAQLLNLAATPDITSAYYRISGDESGDSGQTLNLLRIPWQSKLLALSESSDLYWRASGGYLSYKTNLPVVVDPYGTGSMGYKSTAFSGTAGVLARTRLGGGFTIEPALDVGVARLLNDSSYTGAATLAQPLTDGMFVNWHTNAWLVTPNLALNWTRETDERRISVSGHVAWSWISSFDESTGFAPFHEQAGAYSVRAELAQPTTLSVLGRPLSWVARAGYGGFYGGNRDALGFTSVADIGLGVETPLQKDNPGSRRITAGVSYLFGPNIWGWSANVGMRY
jgi:hypothetical protein